MSARNIVIACAAFWMFLFVFVVQGCHPAYADHPVTVSEQKS